MSNVKNIVLLGLLFLLTGVTEAQQRFFTLSGGSQGDTASAKYEAQISEIKNLAKKHASCAVNGKVFALDFNGKKHPLADENGCIDSILIQANGDVEVKNALNVNDSISIADETIKEHALKEPLMCTAGKILEWDGSAWRCADEDDPEVGNLVSGKWCAAQNGKIVCDRDTPATDVDLEGAFDSQFDSNVRDFARKDKSALETCDPGEILTSDGNTLKCASFDILAGGTLKLDDLSDVDVSLAAIGDLFYFDGTDWKPGQIVEPWSRKEIQYQVNDRCQTGDVLTYDGTNLLCIPDIGGAGDALALEELSDVSGTTDATLTQVIAFNGTHWTKAHEQDPATMAWAKTDVTNLTANACGTDEVLTYDGSVLSCVADIGGAGQSITLAALADTSLTTPVTSGHVLSYDGTSWINAAEADPNVQAFARTANPLPTCAAGNILTSLDGTTLSCTPDADTAAGGLSINDLTDVSVTTPVNGDFLVYTGSGWQNDANAVESFARTPITNLTAGQCAAGEILTYNGTELTCLDATSVGLWSDNTTYITRAGSSIVNTGQALPAALEGAGTRQLWYLNKGAFRAGSVNSAQWDDVNIGTASTALGENNTASGTNSFAAGLNNVAGGTQAIALGEAITVNGNNSVGIGLDATTRTVTDNNTFAIVGGEVGIGTVSPVALLDVAGDAHITSALNVSGTQTIDGVITANSNVNVNATVSATAFVGDGSGLTNIIAGSADWSTLTNVPQGVQDISNTALTATELTQLQNIDAVTISNTQFGYVGSMDQAVATTDNVTFANINGSAISGTTVSVNSDAFVGGALNVSGAQVIDGLMTSNAGINVAGSVTATAFSGDGSGLTNLNVGSLSAPGNDGEIVFNNGGAFAGTSSLYYDDTNSRLGVGTTTPNADLDVAGVVKVAGTGVEACDGAALGTIRYNNATGRLQICRP